MRIRHATLNDLPELIEVFTQAIRATAGEHYSPEQVEAWAAGAENHAGWVERIGTQYFLVAIVDNHPAGLGSLEGDYLDLLFVHPIHMRKGIASQLCDMLEVHAKQTGHHVIRTDASETARPFFERRGYQMQKRNDMDLHGVVIHHYAMRKEL